MEVNDKTGKEKESIGVDPVEIFRGRLERSAFYGGKKIALVENAGSLSVAAQNALLKTLEEPKGDTIIFWWPNEANNFCRPFVQGRRKSGSGECLTKRFTALL